MKTIYIKVSRLAEYYRATFVVSKSSKGCRIAHLVEKERITKNIYYKTPIDQRAEVNNGRTLAGDIHEIGNRWLIDRIEAQEDRL